MEYLVYLGLILGVAGIFGFVGYLLISDGMLERPLASLRRSQTKGLEVGTRGGVFRLGGEVEVVVTVSNRRSFDGVDVGLVCTEHYEYESQSYGLEANTGEVTGNVKCYEVWQPIAVPVGPQSVRFTIPPDAPFSHSEDGREFKWVVVARGSRHHRLDAEAAREITVLS